MTGTRPLIASSGFAARYGPCRAVGDLGLVRDDLAAIPGVLEAHAITGSADVICKVAATSHADLQLN